MKNPLDNYMERGHQQALAAVGALVAVGVAVRRSQGKSAYAGAAGSGARRQADPPSGSMAVEVTRASRAGAAPASRSKVSSKRKAASKQRSAGAAPKAKPSAKAKGGPKGAKPKSQASNEWTRFLSVRVPQLVKQGFTAPEAMKRAADEFRAR